MKLSKEAQLDWFVQNVISQIRMVQMLGNGWKARAQALYEAQRNEAPLSERKEH